MTSILDRTRAPCLKLLHLEVTYISTGSTTYLLPEANIVNKYGQNTNFDEYLCLLPSY